MTPIEKWNGYFYGPNGQRRPMPSLRIDNLDFRLQWYPLETRSLQRYGIKIDYLEYYNESIEHLVRNREQYGKVQIRLDPFNIRKIYVLHPTRNEWLTVTTRHLSLPEASLFELKEAKREARKRREQPTPEFLGKLILERRAHLEQAEKLTRSARRDAARIKQHEQLRADARNLETTSAPPDEIVIIQGPKQEDAAEPERKAKGRPNTTPEMDSLMADTGNLAEILAGISDEEVEELLDGK